MSSMSSLQNSSLLPVTEKDVNALLVLMIEAQCKLKNASEEAFDEFEELEFKAHLNFMHAVYKLEKSQQGKYIQIDTEMYKTVIENNESSRSKVPITQDGSDITFLQNTINTLSESIRRRKETNASRDRIIVKCVGEARHLYDNQFHRNIDKIDEIQSKIDTLNMEIEAENVVIQEESDELRMKRGQLRLSF